MILPSPRYNNSAFPLFCFVNIFGQNAEKAKAIGFTFKCPDASGSDSGLGVAREATLYSIIFTNTIPEAVKEEKVSDIETASLDISKVTSDFPFDVTAAGHDEVEAVDEVVEPSE